MPRVSEIDILRIDYEYCTTKRYVYGDRNVIGEAIRVLTTIYSDVKCSIDPLDSHRSFFMIAPQGMVLGSGVYICFNHSVDIQQNDIVVDVDGNQYEIYAVQDWRTHKDAFGKKDEGGK